MMGETGCGKTSLIRIMAQLMGINMKILNIHAGTNDNDIEDFMKGKTKDNNENLLDEDAKKREQNIENEKKNLEYLRGNIFLEVEDEITPEENESNEDFLLRKFNITKEREQLLIKEFEEVIKKEEHFKKKVWVFLDEINTCNSMGLISEMMCKHSLNGIPIYNNVTFIAACNPYRILSKERNYTGLVSKKEKKF